MPKRSSDFNVLDYRVWANITHRMRKEERTWPKSCREICAEDMDRLRGTALATPRAFIWKAVQDMACRCQLVVEAKGHYFKE